MQLGKMVPLLGLATLTALGLAARPAVAQDVYFPYDATIDADHSAGLDAYVGINSTSLVDGMGNPYNPTVGLVTGGSVGRNLVLFNSSTVSVTGGSVWGYIDAFTGSTASVTGGSFREYLAASDGSALTVSGGSFGKYLVANDSSAVTVTGGTFGQDNGVNFLDRTIGSFTLVGTDLGATDLGADAANGGTDFALSGFLEGGTDLTGYVLNVADGSSFALDAAPAPEPSQFAGLGLGVLGLAGLALRARRRVAG